MEQRIELGKPAEEGELILQRRFRLARRLSSITQLGGRLLDVGCGNGDQTVLFAPFFDQVTAMDIQLKPMRGSTADLQWTASAGENLPFLDDSFDAITCFEVLEHVVDPVRTLEEFHRVLKPGGQIVISVPNKAWIFETHGAHLPVLPWNRVPFFSWLPEPLHSRWAKARIYTMKNLKNLLITAGFRHHRVFYITAPMDRARPLWLQALLRKTYFGKDITSIPFLSVNLLSIAEKR